MPLLLLSYKLYVCLSRITRASGEHTHVLSPVVKVEALDEDVKYKKTDEMKKRAITVAKSYDEFRHLVSCAHLKPVR